MDGNSWSRKWKFPNAAMIVPDGSLDVLSPGSGTRRPMPSLFETGVWNATFLRLIYPAQSSSCLTADRANTVSVQSLGLDHYCHATSLVGLWPWSSKHPWSTYKPAWARSKDSDITYDHGEYILPCRGIWSTARGRIFISW